MTLFDDISFADQGADFDPENLFGAGAPYTSDPEVTYRDFTDAEGQRKAIFDGVKNAYRNAKVSNKKYHLSFEDVDYQSPKEYSKKEEKDAVMSGRRLAWALKGRLVLRDNETGEVVSQDDKPRTITQVPYMTRQGVFINKGTQYMIANQQRLRPGI